VDESVLSEAFWAWLVMMNTVCNILRKAIMWAESCSCHWCILQPGVNVEMPVAFGRAVSECPMRCRRAADLASGEFQAMIELECEVTGVTLLVDLLPMPMTDAVRMALVQEFDMARAHMTFYFTAKLSYWLEFPYSVAAISHHEPLVAKAMMRRALQSDHRHPLLCGA
jgi:hypothetical protein